MMEKKIAVLLCLIFLGLMFPVAVTADTAEESYKKGLAAAKNQDWETAEHEYEKAAGQGHLYAQKALAMLYLCYFDEGAVKWMRMAAQQQDSDAQLALADLLAHGGCDGTVRDYEEAMRWYRQAAKSGNGIHQAGACAEIAAMYEYGLGVAQDLVAAHMWYDLASKMVEDDKVRQGFAWKETDVVSERDRLARKLSPEQIERSRQMQ
ncbi:MAG TPA: tetratricopeptide repeat protein, partial [Acidobacteriota bacterium]|nr:tetratricopeptide repeat protein [Acidobacteriota bacterium]